MRLRFFFTRALKHNVHEKSEAMFSRYTSENSRFKNQLAIQIVEISA